MRSTLLIFAAIVDLALQAQAQGPNVFVTNSGAHPVPVTGSDVTVNTTVDLSHIIAAPGTTPTPSPAKAMVVQGISGATAVGVSNSTLTTLASAVAAPGATPSPSPAQAVVVQGISNGTALPVSVPETAVTVSVSSVSTGATIPAGKHHIEFVFSSDFSGTIGGVTFSGSTLTAYEVGTVPPGYKFPALVYTISAGSAILTTW